MSMSIFGLNIKQRLARARADLRMGAPVVIVGSSAVLIYSAEVLDQPRFKKLTDHFNHIRLVVTARRADKADKIACHNVNAHRRRKPRNDRNNRRDERHAHPRVA